MRLKLVGRHLQHLVENLDVELAQLYNQVDVWCANDEYPPLIEIDCRWLGHKTPYRFRDLIKILPEGMWLHRKYDSYMNQAIATLGDNYNILLSSYNFPFSHPDREEKDYMDTTVLANIPSKYANDQELRTNILRSIQGINLKDQKNYAKMLENTGTKLGMSSDEIKKSQGDMSELEGIKYREIGSEPTGDVEEGLTTLNEEKMREMVQEYLSKKVPSKPPVVPLSAASSKKLIQNKFDTNSTSKFKKAQKKGSTGGKKESKGKK